MWGLLTGPAGTTCMKLRGLVPGTKTGAFATDRMQGFRGLVFASPGGQYYVNACHKGSDFHVCLLELEYAILG